jgi:hypothetical protein
MIIASRFEKNKSGDGWDTGIHWRGVINASLDFVHADDKENTQKEIETIREGKHLNLK